MKMEQPENKNSILSPAQRAALILRISKNAERNPEYKKHVDAKILEVNAKRAAGNL